MIQNLIQKQAPSFKAQTVYPGGEIRELNFASLKGQWVILVFYPLDFTFVCPTEVLAFSDNIQKFKELNCQVFGVSCDSEYCHMAWMNTPRKQGGLGPDFKLPLIADRNQEMAKTFGCLVEGEGFPYRATYIIGPEGKVRTSIIQDTPVGRSVDETLRLLKAFQFSDVHGEVCPVNFKPEERKVGLKPDPKQAAAYFSAVN